MIKKPDCLEKLHKNKGLLTKKHSAIGRVLPFDYLSFEKATSAA